MRTIPTKAGNGTPDINSRCTVTTKKEKSNEGVSAASFCRKVAALFPDMFYGIYSVKNHTIAKNTTTKAWEKISTDLESLEFYGIHLTKFKNNQILLNKIDWQPRYLLGERSSLVSHCTRKPRKAKPTSECQVRFCGKLRQCKWNSKLNSKLRSEKQTCWYRQGILKGEVSLYSWPPVWLVWISLFCK